MTWHKNISPRKTPVGSGRLVMVVDSDPYQLTYHAMLLQRFAYRVCKAHDAEQALMMVAGRPHPSSSPSWTCRG